MKAAQQEQRQLLDVQDLDTSMMQVQHRRRQIPELAQIAAAQTERQVLSAEIVKWTTRVSDLQGEQERAEADLVPVRERLARNEKRVADGSVTDPKQLQALIDEIANVKRRIGELEEAQLEVMEEVEASQGTLDDAKSRRAEGDEALRALMASRDAQLATLDAELAELAASREAVAAGVPADLLTAYTKTAERSGGVGAALLRQGRCGGCQLQLTNADLFKIRAAAADEVVRCEECNRILVRTDESGI